MSKTATTRYDVAEHLRTPEEMAASTLKLASKKPMGMLHSLQRHWVISLVQRVWRGLPATQDCPEKAFTRRSPVNAAQISIPSLKSLEPWGSSFMPKSVMSNKVPNPAFHTTLCIKPRAVIGDRPRFPSLGRRMTPGRSERLHKLPEPESGDLFW